jgi:curved DNA-binding protein CbpA
MNPDKDYYAVLGVLPAAEDVVIRAAYRALAQRYHPDRCGGPQPNAHIRMSELNEACAVLSDAEQRTAYDRRRRAATHAGAAPLGSAEEGDPPGGDPLEQDWRVALKHFPDLAMHEDRLSQFSRRLSKAFRAFVLDTGQFEQRELLAGLMEGCFLAAYFGEDERVLGFARRLILAKQRKAALALNEAVRVLRGGADSARIVARIARDFDLRHLAIDKEEFGSLLARARVATAATDLFMKLLVELGATCTAAGRGVSPGRATAESPCRVEFDGRSFEFASEFEFRAWVRRDVMPMAEQVARR